jgi:uncharacterized protein YndB with AHSA1/START domain
MGTSDENLVQLTRVLRAPPAEVFAAWTEPAFLERWWTGVGGWVDAEADVDLRSAVVITSPCGTSRVPCTAS